MIISGNQTGIIVYLFGINLVALIFYGIDKRRAVRHQWRIPESTLLLLAAVGGGVGALLGMTLWHHKTRKWKFRILVPVFLILWIVGILYLFHGAGGFT